MSIKVLIEYHGNTDEITIKSEFKDVNQTLKLIALAHDKWLKDKIGFKCPNCGTLIDSKWEYCANCGGEI